MNRSLTVGPDELVDSWLTSRTKSVSRGGHSRIELEDGKDGLDSSRGDTASNVGETKEEIGERGGEDGGNGDCINTESSFTYEVLPGFPWAEERH